MGYEAMTGRLPDAVALHFLETGLVGRAEVDRERIDKAREAIRTAAAGIRARDFEPRPTTCRAATARSGRSARRASRADAMPPLDDDRAGGARGRRRGRATGAVIEADNLAVLDALPDGVVDLAYADPPFATGTTGAWSRSGPAGATRRGAGSAAASYRWEAVSDLAWDDALPLDEHLAALAARSGRSTASSRRTARCTCTSTGGRSTTSG